MYLPLIHLQCTCTISFCCNSGKRGRQSSFTGGMHHVLLFSLSTSSIKDTKVHSIKMSVRGIIIIMTIMVP